MKVDRRSFLASGLLLAKAAVPPEPECVVENGFLAAGGVSAGGWYAGVIVLDNRESEFCKGLSDPNRWACRYDGEGFDAEVRKAQRWRTAIRNAPRRLLFRSRSGAANGVIASAERILGPAAAREHSDKPSLAWNERSGGNWSLKHFDGAAVRTVARQRRMISRPAVAVTPEGPVVACEMQDGVHLWSATGKHLGTFHGQRPRLAAAGERLFLLLERTSLDSIKTTVIELDCCACVVRELDVPSRNDYTWKGDIAFSDRLHVVTESRSAFGMHEQLGLSRDLYCWSLDDKDDKFQPVQALCDTTGCEPRLFILNGKVSFAYRQYRVSKARGTYGWDVYLSANRISTSYGNADTGYDIVQDGSRIIGILPCRAHQPGGHITGRYWTEISEVSSTPQESPSTATRCVSVTTPRQICIEPERLTSAPRGLQLIWADLHRHTAYSTCQAATNGSPEEHLRFVRDVLGCNVLTLTEHGHHMTAAESIYVQDRLEEYAGDDRIVLYADEPNPEPGRHTNFYTTDRRVFNELRTIFISHGRARADLYKHIRQTLPKGAVLAISHFHGKPVPSPVYDPEIDVAMEAMQIRGNVMLNLHRESNGLLFPNDCLSLGFKMGLVGGTDHTFALDTRFNHYCLTGLWVREATAAGVFEALRMRRTTAMSNGKVAIWASMNGLPMGSEVTTSGAIRIKTELSCHRPIKRAGLMRDGVMLQWIDVGEKHASIELTDPDPSPGNHWYVVTAEMATAFPTPGLAHASPFFVRIKS